MSYEGDYQVYVASRGALFRGMLYVVLGKTLNCPFYFSFFDPLYLLIGFLIYGRIDNEKVSMRCLRLCL